MDLKWYAMRTRASRADALAAVLPQEFGEHFVPPEISNLLFVRSTFQQLSDYHKFHKSGTKLTFIYDSVTHEPIVVRDKDMDTFMRLCTVSEFPIVMSECPTIKLGSRVRVKEGPLKGLEGNVVRMRKSRRILVNISNVVWAATEFISPDLLEVIE